MTMSECLLPCRRRSAALGTDERFGQLDRDPGAVLLLNRGAPTRGARSHLPIGHNRRDRIGQSTRGEATTRYRRGSYTQPDGSSGEMEMLLVVWDEYRWNTGSEDGCSGAGTSMVHNGGDAR